MACQGQIALTPRTLYSSSSTAFFAPGTAWMPAYGLGSVVGVLATVGGKMNLGLEVGLAWQFAAVRPDSPSAPGAAQGGTMITQDGPLWLNTGALTPTVSNNAWIRFGYAYRSPTATPAEAAVQGHLAWVQCGRIVGSKSFHPASMTTTKGYEPVSEWIAASQVTAARLTQIPTGRTGNLTLQQAYQTATTDPESPDAWALAGTASAIEQTYGEFSPAVSSKMWVRFGLAYGLTAGSALGQADVHTTVAIRK